MSNDAERLAKLKRKLDARSAQPGNSEKVEAIMAKIARLEKTKKPTPVTEPKGK